MVTCMYKILKSSSAMYEEAIYMCSKENECNAQEVNATYN